jgi:hypothetical protein
LHANIAYSAALNFSEISLPIFQTETRPDTFRPSKGSSLSAEPREVVGVGSVRVAWLRSPFPSSRAGYLTKHGDYALAEASRRLAVTIVGGRADGFGGKSADAVVARSDGTRRIEYWLKVSGLIGRERDMFRDAEVESAGLAALPKPTIVATAEWNVDNVFWRAVLMTLAPSPAASPLHGVARGQSTFPTPGWANCGPLWRHCVTRKRSERSSRRTKSGK